MMIKATKFGGKEDYWHVSSFGKEMTEWPLDHMAESGYWIPRKGKNKDCKSVFRKFIIIV